MASANPTMETELEGYSRNGPPGQMKSGGATKAKKTPKRARGGAMALKEHDEKEHEEAEAHHKPKKAGGKVEGKMAMHRPDKRARGGAMEGDTSDEHPLTSANKMTKTKFEEEGQEGDSEGGEGADNDGGHGRD